MISKGWDWSKAVDDVWLKPSEESVVMVYRWTRRGFKKVLDIGCGKGRHSLLFAQHGFEVSGIDLSASAIENTMQTLATNGVNCEIIWADMRDLPFSDGSYDAVFSYLTISHTDTAGVRKTLSEIHRVLKPGGEVFFTLNSSESPSYKRGEYPSLDQFTIIKTKEGPEKGEPHFYADEKILFALLEPFEIIWLNHTHNLYHNSNKNDSWDYYVLAKKR